MQYYEYECGNERQSEDGVKNLAANGAKGHSGVCDRSSRANNTVSQDELKKEQGEEMKLAEIGKPTQSSRTPRGVAE